MKHPNAKLKVSLAFVILVGIVVLFSALSIAGRGEKFMDESSVLQEAQEYLSSRYSANFSIVGIERVSNVIGPLPAFTSSFHWELVVESDQFPGETFDMRYLLTKGEDWRWLDNYFTLLLREEATDYFSELLKEHLDVPFILKICWGTTTWPSTTQEGISICEWLQAGGKITTLQVFLDDTIPTDELCCAAAKRILQTEPNVNDITFFGLSSNGFSDVLSGSNAINIYQKEYHEDMTQLRRVYYGQWQFKEGN